MDSLDIRFYAVVEDWFNSQSLRNLGFKVNDSSKSAIGLPESKSVFCTATVDLSEIEISNLCNLERNTKDMGIKKILYVIPKIMKNQPKPVPKWRNPIAFILYETIGMAIMICLTAYEGLSGDPNRTIAAAAGSIISYFIYELVRYGKKLY